MKGSYLLPRILREMHAALQIRQLHRVKHFLF
jgi:hypothetical protein